MAEAASRSRPPLVLMINDQEWSMRSLESILGPNGYAVLHAYTGRKGRERARSAHPDMIIVDMNLPDMDAFELCRELRDDPSTSPSTPILVSTSGHPTRQQRLAALRAGAWDFLGHPLDAEEVLLRFNAFTRAKLDADRAREEGLLDQLTGLYNVQGLARRAQEVGSQAFRAHGALACVVFAADLGADTTTPTAENAGLAAAERLAAVLKSIGRVSDVMGRLGQTEFAVFAPETGPEGAVQLAKRLAEALEVSAEGPASFRLRAGYHAVRDFREAQIEPVDLLVRASSALRKSRQGNGQGEWIRGYDTSPSTS